jgi:hypothetical protein
LVSSWSAGRLTGDGDGTGDKGLDNYLTGFYLSKQAEVRSPNTCLCKAFLDRITDRAHIIETGTESYPFRRTLERNREKGESPEPNQPTYQGRPVPGSCSLPMTTLAALGLFWDEGSSPHPLG